MWRVSFRVPRMSTFRRSLSRRTLLAAVNSPDLELRPRFLIDSYFKSSKSVFSDSVDWEEVLGDAGLASFRNSGAEAKVVGRTGKVMKTVTLPYIREKSEITAKALLRENALGDADGTDGDADGTDGDADGTDGDGTDGTDGDGSDGDADGTDAG